MNPKKFGGMANHKQELWKSTLPDYIEHLYEKRFAKKMPDDIRSLEVKDAEKRKAQNKRKHQSTQGIDGSKWLQDARTFRLMYNNVHNVH